jgi:hypothetical protein
MSVPTAISEMSSQNIPLKARTDFRESNRILATETVPCVSCDVLGYAARASCQDLGRDVCAGVGELLTWQDLRDFRPIER